MDQSHRGKKNYPPRILEYRSHLKFAAHLVKYTSLFMTVITVLFFTLIFMQNKLTELLPIAFVTLFLTLFLIGQYYFFLRNFALSKIQVFSDKLTISKGKTSSEILFSEVISIKSWAKNHLGGGFTLVQENKKKTKFTVVLERSEYILESLIRYNDTLMDKEQYLALRKSLVLSDHNFARFYDLFKKKYYALSIFLFLILPIGLTLFLFFRQKSQFLLASPGMHLFNIAQWIFIFLCLALMSFNLYVDRTAIRESLVNNLNKGTSIKARDLNLEHKLYKKFFAFYLIILMSLFAGLYATDLNTLSWLHSNQASSHLKVNKGQFFWVDKRYNCLDCKYSLNKGDHVAYQGEVVEVVGFPKETIAVNPNDIQLRKKANLEKLEVPLHHVAVKGRSGEHTAIVPLVEIKGKASKNIPHF